MMGEILKKSFINVMVFVISITLIIFFIVFLGSYGKEWLKEKIAQYLAEVLPF